MDQEAGYSSPPGGAGRPLQLEGADHFKLAHNYRMMHVIDSESFMHRLDTLPRARRVSAPSPLPRATYRSFHIVRPMSDELLSTLIQV